MKGNICNNLEQQKEWQRNPPKTFSVGPNFPLKDMGIVYTQALGILAPWLSGGYQPL